MTEQAPLISIIVAVYNGAGTISRCVESVVAQGYTRKELIVIDGGSNDGTLEILKRYASGITFLHSGRDRGISHAWNKGLAHARGKWICFIGADDYLWGEDVLERMAPFLRMADGKTRVVYGRVNVVSPNGTVIMAAGNAWNRRRFQQVMCIHHQGVFHHHSLFDFHGGFDESYRIAGDYELLLRELKTREAEFVPGIIVAGAQHGGVSSDPDRSLRVLREIARARRQNNIRGLAPLLIWTYIKAIVRRGMVSLLGRAPSRHIANLYRRFTGRAAI